MSVANLTRYDLEHISVKHTRELVPSTVGDWVKFEEVAEASSNSLQQLKAEIAALANELEFKHDKNFGIYILDLVRKLRQLSAV
jgi:hypothetical protein